MRATSPKQVVHPNVSMSCYRGTFVWDNCLQLDTLSMMEPECITHIQKAYIYKEIFCIYMLASLHTYKCAYILYAIFTGFIFRGFSIFADFALLNSQMLAIVPCISIDV